MRPTTLLKKKKIIEVATQLFLKKGFIGTNLDQVIEICGGSKQTIYSYYGDKRGLLIAVVKECIDRVSLTFNFNSNEKSDLKTSLVKFGVNYMTVALSETIIGISRLVITEVYHDTELTKLYLQKGPVMLSIRLSEFLQTQMELGVLRADSPEKAAENLLALLKGHQYDFGLFGVKKPAPKAMKKHVEQAVNCFLQAYDYKPSADAATTQAHKD